jgi:hypothetical protein
MNCGKADANLILERPASALDMPLDAMPKTL